MTLHRPTLAFAHPPPLATLAEEVLRSDEALPALLEHLRTAFGMTSVSLLEQARDADLAASRPGAGRSHPGGPRRPT